MGTVSLELRLLGGFRMVDAANGASIPLRRYDRMFAFLAVHAPDLVPRPEICRILWPGVATGAASSRLRVALTSFGNQWIGLLVRDGRNLGLVELLRGRHTEAEGNLMEGLAMVEPVTTRTAGISRAYLRYALAKNSFVQGECEAANEWMRTALDTGHEYAQDGSYTQYLPFAGLVYFSAGHDREGIRLLADSLRQLHRSGHVRGQQSSLTYAARILWSRGHLETAAHIAGYELAWRERTDRPRTLFHQMVMRGIPARTESQLESAWSSKRPPVQVLRAVYQHLLDLLPGMTGARARVNDVRRPVV